MTTTYYERHGNLYKLEVGDDVLDYSFVSQELGWVRVFDALTRWIVEGDTELDALDAPEAEAKYPGSTGGTT